MADGCRHYKWRMPGSGNSRICVQVKSFSSYSHPFLYVSMKIISLKNLNLSMPFGFRRDIAS